MWKWILIKKYGLHFDITGGFLNNSQIEVLFFATFLMEFIVCMYQKVCVWLDTWETPRRSRGGLFYPGWWTYDPWCWTMWSTTMDDGSIMIDNIDSPWRNTSQLVKYLQNECTTTAEELAYWRTVSTQRRKKRKK